MPNPLVPTTIGRQLLLQEKLPEQYHNANISVIDQIKDVDI
jgi:hypothetical protein